MRLQLHNPYDYLNHYFRPLSYVQHMEARRWLGKLIPATKSSDSTVQAYLSSKPSLELAKGVLHVLAMLCG